MVQKINWGIIGPGNIAHKFAHDLMLSKTAQLYGVASRDPERAKNFGRKYKAVKHYGSYAELAADPDIDVVYIATPHTFHFENTMLCLKEGKAVLCEKPMGMNSGEVKAMIDEARSRNLFLMEAIWTRFIPGTIKMLELVHGGAIGSINFIRADFGFRAGPDRPERVFNKSLGGGSLLDIGIYPLYLALLLLGMPTDLKAMARMSKTEVDSFCAMLLDYRNGAKAVLESTFEADTPTEAYIYGEKGTIHMHPQFHHTQKLSLFQEGELRKKFDIQYTGNGYYHEIEEVHNCLLNGKTESDKIPLSVSMDLMTLLDRVKKEIGLEYEADR